MRCGAAGEERGCEPGACVAAWVDVLLQGLARPHGRLTTATTSVRSSMMSPRIPTIYAWAPITVGRVAFHLGNRVLSVRPDGRTVTIRRKPSHAESFQWMETPRGDLVLMSLQTNRCPRVNKSHRSVTVDSPGLQPSGMDGARFSWEELHGE